MRRFPPRRVVLTLSLALAAVLGPLAPAEARSETVPMPGAQMMPVLELGQLVNADAQAYALALTCGAAHYTSSVEAGETVLLQPPAAAGCTLTVVETKKSLPLSGPRLDIRIEGGTPRHPIRFLEWKVEMRTYGDAGEWPAGVVRQWAASASASSEYSEDGWCARQATGEPNTHACGDIATAWTTKEASSPEKHWIELRYPKKVRAIGARLFITNAPGAVHEIQGRTGSGWETLWRGTDPVQTCPAILELRFTEEIDTDTIRVVLDLTRQQSWFELDAVELIGKKAR